MAFTWTSGTITLTRRDPRPFEALPHRPEQEPVFAEPWQAQVFALAVQLHDAGHFTWSEWAEALGREIKAAQERGDPDDGSTYYWHWLAALRTILSAKDLASETDVEARKAAWAAIPSGMVDQRPMCHIR